MVLCPFSRAGAAAMLQDFGNSSPRIQLRRTRKTGPVGVSSSSSVVGVRRTYAVVWVAAVVTLCLAGLGAASTADANGKRSGREAASASSEQPRIITQSGHLIFQTAENHNITFRSSNGGSIIFDGEDLRRLIQVVKENSRQLEELKTSNVALRLRSLEEQLSNLRNSSSSEISALNQQIVTLTRRLASAEQLINGTNFRRLGRRFGVLGQRVDDLFSLLNINECTSNPCRNGGTCVDQFNGFLCQCPSSWQGSTCETDVDECRTLFGTDLGCQHGATCVNTPGSFRCMCTPNYYGQRCTETHDDCANASNYELCAHGTCYNVPRQNGQRGFRCMCDPGWTTGPDQPACNVDVNECTAGRSPCSTDPLVLCVNTPGSFVCGPCPAGFSGNGFTCIDINECETNNGGCSQAPRVLCTNTVGSRRCASCPDGYTGDGIICHFVGICGVNNGGCHALASCRETPGIIGRACSCPPGYVGSGVGVNGCVMSGNPCTSNPCGRNGQCQATDSGYLCTCNPGWSGAQCSQRLSPCSSNPCLNGGTCMPRWNGSFTCLCTADFTGPLCADAQSECGGILIGEEGVLAFPRNTTRTYPNNVACLWQIRTISTKSLQLRFTNFKLEEHANCASDFVAVHDGVSIGSHLIGRYCGMLLPNGNGVINTTHSQAAIYFKSDASVNYNGFRLVWSSVTPSCGGAVTGDHGTVMSPSFPGLYPYRRDCSWTISAPPGKRILLTFGSIDIEDSANCTKDYVEIRDGLLDTSQLVQRFCGIQQPPPQQLSGPYAYIYFHSDETNNGHGFQFTFIASSGCGGELTGDSGVLISPNYPNPYPHSVECIWTITAAPQSVMTFKFTDMDLERHDNCAWDFVEVRDGGDELADFVGRFCGNSTPQVSIVSTSNKLWIKFRSDSSTRGSGFRAVYEVACGGLYTEPTGLISSPYFPLPYPNDRECIYQIRQLEGSTITLTFLVFDVESGGLQMTENNCVNDFVEVRNGETADAPMIGRFCGSSTPAPVQSSGRSLWIKFKSDGSVRNHGFRARYRTSNTDSGIPLSPLSPPQPQSRCGGLLTASSGTFSSPNSQTFFPEKVNCTWFIRVTPGFIITLTFDQFSLEHYRNCPPESNYVEVFDNFTTVNSLGRFCGETPPQSLTSSDNSLTLRFVFNSTRASHGFTASYRAINSTGCGFILNRPTGVIVSPNYPNSYPHDRACEWVIVLPPGQQILLNFTDFELEPSDNCANDFLEIRNGGFATSPLFGTYCGTNVVLGQTFRSHSNRLYLKFVSNPSVSRRGFRISYDGTASGCGGELTGVTGSFVSPNHPLPYGQNAICIWTITVSQGSKIILEFPQLDLERHVACAFDYIEARDSNENGQRLARLCGNSTSPVVTSLSNRMWIKFRTDMSNHGQGFYARYRTSCNTILTGFSGVIESPNFPFAYPANFNCSWVIRGTAGNTVNASFSQFDVDTGSQLLCSRDYVELRNGPEASSTLIGRYCGQQLPPSVATTQQSLYVKFVTDGAGSRNGFSLQYSIQGCGGYFSAPTGEFTSPNYPQPYPNQRECLWTIEVDIGKRINLTITNFSMEHSVNCTYDAFEVYGGVDTASPRLLQLCETISSQQSSVSTSNILLVRFKSDVSNTGLGFRATYEAIDGGCGGVHTTRSGVIMSTNYPSTYPHNSDCVWQIIVEPQHSVVLTFEDFEIEQSTLCRFDYVAVYGSADFNSSQLLRACGNSTPGVVQSTTNEMFVRMRSDSSRAHRGFKASYVTGCGGHINADTDGHIVSPGWPNAYPSLSNCTWIIETSNPGDHVTLTFTHLDIEDSTNCTNDYVEILEGNSEADGIVLQTLCGTTAPAPITSHGSAFVVRFASSRYNHRRGFQARYTASASACGGTLTAEHGYFNSPGYPDAYANNIDCEWTISASPGNRLMLSFSFFELESSDSCENDYVEVFEGGISSNNSRGRFCGSQSPVNLTADQYILVKFHSNEDLPGRGFAGSYNSLYGGNLLGNTGQLSSPLYPSNYPHGIHYTWTITVEIGMRIKVTFVTLDLEGPVRDACRFDYLRLYDGDTVLELGSFCGSILPSPVFTSSNRLQVVFHTDVSTSGHGFLLNWEAVPLPPSVRPTSLPPGVTNQPNVSLCGGLLISGVDDAIITSPGFPNAYPNNISCVWFITAGEGEHVQLQFRNLSLESHRHCLHDYIEIIDGVSLDVLGRNIHSLGRFCGRSVPTGMLDSSSNFVMVRFVSDNSISSTGFSLVYRTACGSVIRDLQSGFLQSPQYPNLYPGGVTCTWTIILSSGMSVLANFSALAISGEPPECIPGDYVEIFNGESVSSPSLGKFCGTQVPPAITSSSNRLTLQFVSDRDGQASTGFHLFFSQVSRECGGNIELTYEVPTAEISSPNYPQEYPLSTDCSWVLRAPANKRVRFSFVGDFSLESHPGCQYDYVELRDGATVSSPLIEKRFCGAVRPNSILLSSGAVMFVRFHTDDSRSEAGFKAVIGYALCGGTVSGANGTLSSPNYPEQYPNDAYCEWFVEAPRGHYIEFTLTDLRLESNVNCSAGDFLEIRDVNSTGTQLLMACGVDIPLGTITTSDSFAYVRFQSNGQNTNNGFRLSFASSVEECGGTLTSDTGVIKSPNYPGYYAHRRRCHWVIRVQKSRKITLTFEDIDIESLFQRITPMCTGDFIQVLNGYLPQSPEIGRFCSKVLPGPIESSANVMSVMFQSETGLAGRGFKATYTSDKMADCGFTLCPVSETIIESPGFSDNSSYNASQQCIWTISCPSLPAESTMVIRFLALDLERHGECIYDFVELREGDDENGVLMGRYCHLADQPLPLILSPSPSMWIRFVSDYSDAGRGFQLSSSIAACGGVLTEDHGTIVNPVASERMDCAWVITAPIGSQIKLTFTTLSLPYEVNCTKSYIEVINGYLVSAPSAGKFCQLPVNTFRSQSHQIRLLYHSDVAVQTPNTFVIRYDFETQGCGGMYQAQRGFIMSPNYPSNYNNSIECIWDITVQNGYHIRWAFNDQFQIDDADGCASDNVQIVEVGPNGETVGVPSRYCGSIQPPPGISYGNKIQVKFRSNDIFGGRGFLMNFTAECGAVYNGTEGTIVSPGFPDNYDNNLNCTYEITGNPQKHTILRFTPGRFFIRDHPPHTSFLSGIDRFEPAVYECSRDYLEIFALGNGTEPPQKLRRLCGRMAPPVLSTLGGIRINFVTDSANTDRGWSIQFQLADCGGTLTEPEGTIQSVLYPDSYHDNANCTWVITVPDNKLIKLQFEKFSLEPHPRCEFDYVAIYNGLTINPDNLQQQYCGDRVPPVFLSTGSNIVVNFVTDTSRTGEGFVAQYESVYGPAHGCGGTVRIDAGMNATIRSPDIDGDGVYDDELDCVWQIDVPENYVAHVQFMELQLEVGPTSCVDYLEIHDGRTVMDPLIGSQYCNQPAVPFNISSSSNALFLRMYTDVSIGDSGFRAIVVAVPRACGGVLTSRPTPTPLTYQARQSNERCRWIIEAPENEQVEINVTMVNIDELSLCAKDYLELRDHQLLDPHSPVVLCQRRIPQLFISSGRTAQVNFVIGSDRNVPSRSFSLTYKTASCNRILTSNSSRVVSPRWPSTYPINANCEVKIITPAGYKLAIFFAVFELEQHENCAYDYLAIYNSTVVAAESLVPPSPLCGRTVPDPIFLNTNTALLKFVTDGSLTHAGYDITYLASPDGCGGQLWDVNGTFTSPGYPQTVSTTVKCHWLISVPQQRHVNLLLTILPSLSTLPPSADCTSSFVSVYDSLSLDPERLRGTFCTAESIAVMTSSSNNMLVVYSSNATSVNIAFRAVYWSTIATGALPIIPSSRSEDYGYDLYD